MIIKQRLLRAEANGIVRPRVCREKTAMSQKHMPSFRLTGNSLAAIALLGFAGYFLLIEDRQHPAQWLPLLILLLCPLLHIFMHREHGKSRHAQQNLACRDNKKQGE
jgi:drug/metabolite transporter (DMT)-like permease